MFSGSLSENDRKSINERDHKFYCTLVIFECAVNFFFPTWKNVPGAYSERFSDIIGHREHPENTLKRRFLSKKGPKEGERVARGHFHERVGESPVRGCRFATNAFTKSCFVSEIRPFEKKVLV